MKSLLRGSLPDSHAGLGAHPRPCSPNAYFVTASSTGLSSWQQWPSHPTNGSNSSLSSEAPVDSPWTWAAWQCAVQTESPTQTCGHDVTIRTRGDLPQALGEITSTVTSQWVSPGWCQTGHFWLPMVWEDGPQTPPSSCISLPGTEGRDSGQNASFPGAIPNATGYRMIYSANNVFPSVHFSLPSLPPC